MPELARPGFAPVCTDATVDYEHDSRGRVAEQPILREAHMHEAAIAAAAPRSICLSGGINQ